MIETILLDAGGVLVYPATGLWLRPRGFHEIIDKYLAGVDPEAHRQALHAAARAKTEDEHMYTEEIECVHMRELFSICYREKLGLPVTDGELDALAVAHVYDTGRYALYDDVLPTLAKWKEQGLRLGLVSDTLPSLRRSLLEQGVLPYLEVTSLSCDNGVLKPDARMWKKALEGLGVTAGGTIFVDDLDKNLLGARRVGIRAVKMARAIYTEEAPAPSDWDGPVVHSLEELDARLGEL